MCAVAAQMIPATHTSTRFCFRIRTTFPSRPASEPSFTLTLSPSLTFGASVMITGSPKLWHIVMNMSMSASLTMISLPSILERICLTLWPVAVNVKKL